MTMDFTKYENKLPYSPTDPNPWAEKVAELKAALEEAREQRRRVRSEMRDAYNAESSRLQEQFKADLFDELGIANNPHRERLFSKAWEMGHSGGYAEVYNVAVDLVDLVS